jgi:transketolase N-terminal domain/subunit
MAEIATALYTRHLKFPPQDAGWFDGDRVVLSNGHGSMLYSLLHLTGYPASPIEEDQGCLKPKIKALQKPGMRGNVVLAQPLPTEARGLGHDLFHFQFRTSPCLPCSSTAPAASL